MGALSALRNLFVPTHTVLAHIDDPFIQMDLRDTIHKLRLEERGVELGELNLPAADAKVFDNVEREIIHEVNEYLSRMQIEGANNARAYDARLAGLTLLTQLSSISVHAKTAVSDFRSEVIVWKDRLANARDAIADSFEDLRNFRSLHGLSRPAYELPSAFVTWGAILFSWFIETLLNTALLRMNDSMGVLGGAVAAGGIGALNVGISALIGVEVWPYLNHKNWRHKFWAGAVTAMWGVGLVIWNLLAAHYRDAKAAGIAHPESVAPTTLLSAPFALDSIYSWGLLAAGLTFALIAAFAGFRMRDPYPGYGEVHDRHEVRCEDYTNDKASAIDDLREIRDEAIAEAQDVREELARQLRQREEIKSYRDTFGVTLEQRGRQLENDANALLEAYRTANRRARTEPPPAHFDERWILDPLTLPPAPSLPLPENEIRTANATLTEVITEISKAFDEAVASFDSLEALKDRLRNAKG